MLLAQQNRFHVLPVAQSIGLCPLQTAEHVKLKKSHSAFISRRRFLAFKSMDATWPIWPLLSNLPLTFNGDLQACLCASNSLLQDPAFWRSIVNSLMNLIHSNDAAYQSNPFAQ